MTLWNLLRQSDTERTALSSTDGISLSYAELRRQVEEIGHALYGVGIGRNDSVALVLPDGVTMAVAFLGVACAATAAPLNPGYRAEEFRFYLDDLKARIVLVPEDSSSPVRGIAADLGIPILEVGWRAGALQISGATPNASAPDAPVQSDDVALILHTSGTTARPKLVPLTQRNLCASARHVAHSLALSAQDRCLNLMPLFHIHGLVAGLLAPLSAGGTVICPPSFSAADFFPWLATLRPTWYTAVPTMHQAILSRAAHHPEIREQARLRFIRSSSASLPPAMMVALEETFHAPVIEAYGMTEAAHQMASNPLPPGVRKPGSVGLPAGPEIGIMDEAGRLLPSGAMGEVVIRGENVMAGYLENPDANAVAFSDGWFRTGDEGRFDEDGYLFLTGRLKEIINRGGEKIAPREVDEVLLVHPAVAQAVTFATSHPQLGEEVAAAVVLKPGSAATAVELQRFAAAHLADFKIPRRIRFVDEIPKGATGKVQRIGLAERLKLTAKEVWGEETQPADVDPAVQAFIGDLWCEIFHLSKIANNLPFTAIGGTSLQAMQLINQINALLAIDLTIVDFFDAATIREQARVVQARLLAQMPLDSSAV
ncbi:MAG: AMP-binding protein [Caldilineaceae bacterium]|nr:AMP-binding protein [Caldilineaceae bacterium]